MEKELDVRAWTLRCLAALQQCVPRLGGHGLQMAQSLCKRFDSWISGIGVLAEYHVSLDYRLREAPRLAGALLDMLQILELQITRVSKGAEAYALDEPDKPAADYQPLHELDSMNNTIGWLHNFSYIVRGSGVRDPLSRAARFKLKKEEREAVDALESAVRDILDRFPLCSSLADRIANAVVLRRKYFLHCRAHQERLSRRLEESHHQEEPGMSEQAEEPDSEPQPREDAQSPQAAAGSSGNPISARNVSSTHADSKTEVTDVLEDGAYVDDAAPQPPPTDASSWLGYTGAVEIPRAPDIEGSKEYRCPYCCLTLPADVFTDDERWRRHIVKDLWPYVCVHEDCPFPEELFSSSRAWRGHLRKPHKSEWVCPLHPDTGANMSGAEQGEDLAGVFRSEEAFQAHMDTHHVGAFSEKQINALKRRSHRTLRAVVSCPFCDLEDRRGPGETQHLPDGVNIYQHIGEHLLALALMSLPPRDDLAEDENDRVDLEGASDFKRALAQLSTYNPLDQLSLQGSIDHLADPSKDDEEFGPGQPIEDPTANAFSELALLATTDSELAQEAPALGADETPASTIAPHSPQWLDEDNQSDEEDQHDLKKSILERLVPSALDNLEFLPAGLIDKLVSYEVVTRHLGFDDLSHSYAERQLYQGSSPLAAAPESQTLPERIEGSYRKRQLATSTNRFTKQNFSLASLAEAMQQPVENGGIQLQNRRWHLRLYMNCFIGSDMTTWLLENFVDLEDRREAEALGNRLMVPEDDEPEGEGNEATKKAKKESDGLFIHVERRHQFRDGNYYYQFSSEYAKPNPAGWFTKTKKAMVVPSTSEQQELVGYVIYEAKKLFATCVLAGLGGKSLHRAMSQFRQLGFNDLSLPITDEIMPRIPFFGSKMSEYTWPWDSSSILNFCKQQWVFLAPIFPSVTYELDLQPGYILPFTFISDILNDGTSSILYQATIHPAHCRYNSPTAADGSLKVALKEIKRRRTGDAQLAMSLEPDWQRSLAAHRQARSFNHPNIIRPLAAIVRNPTAYLMYEWADGGNLRDYWRSNRRPDLTPRFIKLMVEQLRGLADALETLHNSEGGSYRHGDIKPENILRLRGEGLAEAQADLGVLKLSGFGIARYHEEVTAVRHSATTTMSSPRMYEAPGAATSFNQPRSRRYDIWSMGCVILEFIAWALYGHDGLEVMDSRIAGDFGRPSPLYVIDRTGFANTARLHPEVNTIMNVIAADRECRGHTALGDLLRLVRDRLLVVNLSLQQSLLSASKSEQLPSIIISDPTGPSERQSAPDFEAVPPDNGIARADAGELRDALETIIRRGNVSENYWFTRTSRAGTSLSLGVGPEQLPTWSVSESLRSAPSGGKRPQASTISQGGIPEFTSSEDVDEHLDDGLEHRQRDLRDQLFSALVTTRSGEDRFLPNGLLTSLITESRVRNELSISIKRYQSAFNIPQLARTICEGNAGRAPLEIHADQRGFPSFRRVFATLAMIDKTNEILEFITHDVRDSHLPLTRLTQSLDSQDGEFVLGDRGTALEFTRKWGPVAIEHFERLQWATLSPFFSKSEMRSQTNHYALQDQIILPFVKQDLFRRTALEETMGGHSVVFKVYIHPDHHNFGDGSQKFMPFAIKQLLTANKEAFEKEVSVLRRFSHDAHPHLLSLLATYQQSEKFNIILPWATADLEEYWRTTNPRPRFEQATVTWVAEQCYGIANGLVRIHRYAESDYSSVYKDDQYVFGHHGNVIPQNILWFAATESGKIGGTLKLSNFGTTGWAADATETLVVSPTYRAPESDQRGFRISRAYDMWSLGCLYLEFVTWLLGGWEMVQQFAKLRMSVDATWYEMQIDTFFDLVKSDDGHEMGARVKPAVTKFIEQLHGHTFCSDFVHDFLDIIQHRLLVVLPQDTARNDAPGTGRVSCEQLDHELRRIRNLCQEDVEYASRPSPRV